MTCVFGEIQSEKFIFRAFLGNLIGSCWLLVTIVEEISGDLKLFDEVETPNECRKIFYDILDNYVDARQLSKLIYF